jgi:cardiolipin synthase
MSKTWSKEEIFFDGDEYFESILRDIDRSKRYITVEMYIFSDDPLGKKFAAHLISARQRGVKVQILVDAIGSFGFLDRLYEVFQKKDILVKFYNPLPFIHPYYGKLTFLKRIYVLGTRLWRLNRRNHRKIITIDEHIMYAGSFNITAVHTSYHSEKAWKDIGLKVVGEHVQYAVLNFKKTWKLRDYFRYKKQMKRFRDFNWKQSPIRLNQTLFMKRFFFKNFFLRIGKAKERVWLMTPYFIPQRRLIRALGKAAEKGVDVRLLLSQKTDVAPFRWLQFFYYSYLLKKGVKIYQYRDSVLHAKNYIIDDFMTVGSTNLNHRSFIHDLEVDLELLDENNKKIVEQHFLDSSLTQENITTEDLKQRPLWDRFLSRLFFLFKYWF